MLRALAQVPRTEVDDQLAQRLVGRREKEWCAFLKSHRAALAADQGEREAAGEREGTIGLSVSA